METQNNPLAQNLRDMKPPPEVLPTEIPTRFIYFSGFIFFLTALIYVGITFGYKGFISDSIEQTNQELNELGIKIGVDEQNEIIGLYSQINNLKTILDNHVELAYLFEFFEQNTDKRVKYNTLSISTVDKSVSISAVAASYDALVSQLAIYDRLPEIERMSLSDSSRLDNDVVFGVNLIMKEYIFDPKI